MTKPTFIHSQSIDKFLSKITPNLPYSYLWIYKNSLGKGKTILDIGCGDGLLMQRIMSYKKVKITGIDIFDASLKKAKKNKLYSQLIKGDVVKICERLVKQKKKYDTVFCSQVIEHITKKDGNKLLILMDKLAIKRVVVATPIGFMNQPEVFIGKNPYQYHKSGWTAEEFLKHGYKVYGMGFKPAWSETGLSRGKNPLVVSLFVVISYLASPLVYYFPVFAAGMMCIKEKR